MQTREVRECSAVTKEPSQHPCDGPGRPSSHPTGQRRDLCGQDAHFQPRVKGKGTLPCSPHHEAPSQPRPRAQTEAFKLSRGPDRVDTADAGHRSRETRRQDRREQLHVGTRCPRQSMSRGPAAPLRTMTAWALFRRPAGPQLTAMFLGPHHPPHAVPSRPHLRVWVYHETTTTSGGFQKLRTIGDQGRMKDTVPSAVREA